MPEIPEIVPNDKAGILSLSLPKDIFYIMTDQDNLKAVYTGSSVEAAFIKNILEDNGIGCIVRDSLTESIHAGWASGVPESSNRLFVSQEHEAEAKKLIKEFLNSSNA